MTDHKDTHLVIQQGGSSGEFYPDVYESIDAATDAINAHAAASYPAFGPYPVSEGLSKLDPDEWTEILALIAQACTDVASQVYAAVDEKAVAKLVVELESGNESEEPDRYS